MHQSVPMTKLAIWTGITRHRWYVSDLLSHLFSSNNTNSFSAFIGQVLNCQDYHFTEYSAGADILLHDTYPIGINSTWSTVYNTACTKDYGDCGCDNCGDGGVTEIANRLDEFYQRLDWEGSGRKSVGVWSVGQAFGNAR